jgi:hypothetical protein
MLLEEDVEAFLAEDEVAHGDLILGCESHSCQKCQGHYESSAHLSFINN